MADWHAAMPVAGWRPLGVTVDSRKRPHRPDVVLYSRQSHRHRAWIYQEDTEDTGCGLGVGAQTNAGDAKMKKNPHWGSSLDDFLKEEGIYDEVVAQVDKEVIAWQLQQAMKKKKITKIGRASCRERV